MQTSMETNIYLKIPDEWNNEFKPTGIKIKFKKDCEYSKMFGIEDVELVNDSDENVVLFALNKDIEDDQTAYDDITEFKKLTNIIDELFSALKVYLENSENRCGDKALATICINIAVIKLAISEEENQTPIVQDSITINKDDILCLKYLDNTDIKKYEMDNE